MTPLTIAYFADGNSIHTGRWISWFAARGHSVTLVSTVAIDPSQQERYKKLGITIKFLIDSGKFPLILKPAVYLLNCILSRYYIRKKADICQVLYVGFNALYALCGKYRYLVGSVWGSDILLAPRQFRSLKWIISRFIPKADIITGEFSKIYDAIQEIKSFPQNQFKIIQHGVDTKKFTEKKKSEIIPLKKKYNIADDAFVLVSPRALHPHYNIQTIVEACLLLKKNGIHCVLLQAVFNKDNNYYKKIKEYIVKNALSGQIIFLEQLDHEMMPKLYNLADVVISIPDSDGLSISIMEAMACEKIIIANSLESNRTLLEETQKDFLIKENSATGVAEMIQKHISTPPDNVQVIQKKNRATACGVYGYEANMQKMENILSELMARQ